MLRIKRRRTKPRCDKNGQRIFNTMNATAPHNVYVNKNTYQDLIHQKNSGTTSNGCRCCDNQKFVQGGEPCTSSLDSEPGQLKWATDIDAGMIFGSLTLEYDSESGLDILYVATTFPNQFQKRNGGGELVPSSSGGWGKNTLTALIAENGEEWWPQQVADISCAVLPTNTPPWMHDPTESCPPDVAGWCQRWTYTSTPPAALPCSVDLKGPRYGWSAANFPPPPLPIGLVNPLAPPGSTVCPLAPAWLYGELSFNTLITSGTPPCMPCLAASSHIAKTVIAPYLCNKRGTVPTATDAGSGYLVLGGGGGGPWWQGKDGNAPITFTPCAGGLCNIPSSIGGGALLAVGGPSAETSYLDTNTPVWWQESTYTCPAMSLDIASADISYNFLLPSLVCAAGSGGRSSTSWWGSSATSSPCSTCTLCGNTSWYSRFAACSTYPYMTSAGYGGAFFWNNTPYIVRTGENIFVPSVNCTPAICLPCTFHNLLLQPDPPPCGEPSTPSIVWTPQPSLQRFNLKTGAKYGTAYEWLPIHPQDNGGTRGLDSGFELPVTDLSGAPNGIPTNINGLLSVPVAHKSCIYIVSPYQAWNSNPTAPGGYTPGDPGLDIPDGAYPAADPTHAIQYMYTPYFPWTAKSRLWCLEIDNEWTSPPLANSASSEKQTYAPFNVKWASEFGPEIQFTGNPSKPGNANYWFGSTNRVDAYSPDFPYNQLSGQQQPQPVIYISNKAPTIEAPYTGSLIIVATINNFLRAFYVGDSFHQQPNGADAAAATAKIPEGHSEAWCINLQQTFTGKRSGTANSSTVKKPWLVSNPPVNPLGALGWPNYPQQIVLNDPNNSNDESCATNGLPYLIPADVIINPANKNCMARNISPFLGACNAQPTIATVNGKSCVFVGCSTPRSSCGAFNGKFASEYRRAGLLGGETYGSEIITTQGRLWAIDIEKMGKQGKIYKKVTTGAESVPTAILDKVSYSSLGGHSSDDPILYGFPIDVPGQLDRSSPTIVGDMLYIGAWSPQRHNFNPSNGGPVNGRIGSKCSFADLGGHSGDGHLFGNAAAGTGSVFPFCITKATAATQGGAPAPADLNWCDLSANGNLSVHQASDYNLYAYKLSTDDTTPTTLAWTYSTGKSEVDGMIGSGIVSSPTVADGVVYVGALDGYLYALDAIKGTLKWQFKAKGPIFSKPIVSNDGNTVFISAAFDPDTNWHGAGGDFPISSNCNMTSTSSWSDVFGTVYAINTKGQQTQAICCKSTPYRNPILGYRKQLKCCLPSFAHMTIGDVASGVGFDRSEYGSFTGTINGAEVNALATNPDGEGAIVNLKTTKASGKINSHFITSLTLTSSNNHTVTIPLKASPNSTAMAALFIPSTPLLAAEMGHFMQTHIGERVKVTWTPPPTKAPTNTVYKDNYAKSCGKARADKKTEGACYQPIIKKKQNRNGFINDQYNYSAKQYLNRRCRTYKQQAFNFISSSTLTSPPPPSFSLRLKWSYAMGSLGSVGMAKGPTLSHDGAMIYMGTASDTGAYLYAIHTADASVKWKFPTKGQMKASPCLSHDGTEIYASSGSPDGLRLYAIHTADASLKWIYIYGSGAMTNPTSSPAISTDGTLVYVGFGDSLLAYKTDGMSPSGGSGSLTTVGLVGSSPAVFNYTTGGDYVYVGSDDEHLWGQWGTNFIAGLGQALGLGGKVFSSPAIWPVSQHEVVIYVGSFDKNLYAVKAHKDDPTGEILWEFETGDKVWSSPAISPDGTIVYVGSDDYNLYAISVPSPPTEEHALLWKFETGGPVQSSPTVSPDGTVVYVGSDDYNLYAIDAKTGKKLGSFKTGGQVKCSPTVSPDGTVVYVGSNDNNLYAIAIDVGSKILRPHTFATKCYGSLINNPNAACSIDCNNCIVSCKDGQTCQQVKCSGYSLCAAKNNNCYATYKPNNRRFSSQGAVSGGSRINRLKYQTQLRSQSTYKIMDKGSSACQIKCKGAGGSRNSTGNVNAINGTYPVSLYRNTFPRYKNTLSGLCLRRGITSCNGKKQRCYIDKNGKLCRCAPPR